MHVVIDTETTGLTTKSHDFMAQPGIVQIGAIKLEQVVEPMQLGTRWKEVDSFYVLVNPEISNWEEGAIKTHGITPAIVADAPTFYEVGPALAKFMLGCECWVGFNTKFDRDVLWWQLMKYGFERSFPWPPSELDVMKVAGRVMEQQGKRGTKNPKLAEAYEHFFGTTFDGAHDALADVRATAKVWLAAEGDMDNAKALK